ncbi:hypothetical protein, partial [Mesorhizobium sp. M0276]|uniref:hypothetical protein n=1 Tax=Mesorhizobium sp. M0276 TaxID=2956928 RepID=UPI00333D8BA2
PPTDDKPLSGSARSFMVGVVSGKWFGSADATKSYVISTACATSTNPHEFFRLALATSTSRARSNT